MAYRFTNTDKWGDSWFSNLKVNDKLLFMYLCDECDVAGFIEINKAIWCAHTGLTLNALDGALEGLMRGIVISANDDCVYIKNFLKHQKNLPLNENNNAHRGILKRFELYAHKFDIQDVESFILGASEGLLSPIGKGKGKDTSKKSTINRADKIKETIEQYKLWREESEWSLYRAFITWMLDEKLEACFALDDQFTQEKFKTLMKKNIKSDVIKAKISGMENSKDLEKKNKSFSRTLNNWLNYKGK